MSAIIESKDNIDAMVKSEREVLARIRTYMISGYEDRVEKYTVTDQNAKRNMTSTDSSLKKKFWNNVMSSFWMYISIIDNSYAQRHGYQEPERRGRKPASVWVDDPIQEFKDQFSIIEDRYLIHSRHHKKCTELFSELLEEIKSATVLIPPQKALILGRANFKYIDKMLDINDDAVCALLPFLLTAYVYNFRKNRFMNRGTESVEGAFSEKYVDTTRVAATKRKLEILSTCFGFSDRDIKFPPSKSRLECRMTDKGNSKLMDSDDKTFSVLIPKEYPSLKFREVLDSVFAIWCNVICGPVGSSVSEIDQTVYEKVDIALCVKLYLYYTDSKLYYYLMEKGFPSAQKIYDFIMFSYASDPSFMPHTFKVIHEITQ